MHVYERRRLAVVAVFTLIAVPAVFALDRGRDSSAEDVPGASIPDQAEQSNQDLAVDVVVDSIAPEIPVFLDNEVLVPAPAVIDIARPAGPSATETTAKMTFKRYVDAPFPQPCSTRLAPSGATITVTNLNNGLSTTCENTLSVSIPAGSDMALDTPLYLTVADLVDAPVPVRLTW